MALIQDPDGAGAANTVDAITPVFTGKKALVVAVSSVLLPTGASTATNQVTGNTSLGSIDTKIPTLGQKVMAGSKPVVIASDQSAIPVSGAFFQATQPVSGTVVVSNFPSSQVVTGSGSFTIAQATAANLNATVVGSVSVSNLPVSQAVTGTFFQGLQPVSVSNFPASQAVTGSFFQATQPISGTVTATGPLTDTQLRATAVPVSGTVAISGTPSVSVSNFPASQAVTGTFFPGTQPVSGTFFQATQPISAVSLPLPTSASTSAKQPAIGVAGTASVDVLTVQGAVGMTALKVDASATTQPVSGTVTVGNFPGTQPVSGTITANAGTGTMAISAVALPLPTGASTEITLALIKAKTDNLDVALSTRAVTGLTDTQLRATPVPVSGTVTATGTFFQSTQPVSAATLPLPTGAAQDSTLTGGTQKAIARGGTKGSTTAADVTSTAVDVNTQALDVSIKGSPTVTVGNASLAVTGSFFQATQPISGAVSVSNFPVTQPVSGTVTANVGTGTMAVSAVALPLPAGASTEVTLALIKAKTDNLDVALSTRAITGLTDTQLRASAVPVSGTVAVTGTFFQATQPVSATALPLPTGASTAAKQPAIGTAGTASVDVLTVQGATGMTALKVDGTATTQPISGTVAVSNFPASQAVTGTFFPGSQPVTGTFFQTTQPISGAVSVSNFPATQPVSGTVAVTGTFFQGTQPVSGTVSNQTLVGAEATYSVSVTAQANTVASHAIAIEAGTTKKIYLKKIIITQPGTATAAAVRTLLLERTTGAGAAGVVTAAVANASAVALAQLDPADAAFTGIVRAKPTTLGTQGATIMSIPIFVPAALAAFVPIVIDLEAIFGKPIVVTNGIANGIALRDPGSVGGANFGAIFIFSEK